MTVVADASAVVALLIDAGPVGRWARDVVVDGPLLAPHLMPGEVTNILRRRLLAGDLSGDNAAMAHADLVALPVELISYAPCAGRVWELHPNLTAYDAWYVAIAEAFDGSMATLDLRLARARGPRCAFLTPPAVA